MYYIYLIEIHLITVQIMKRSVLCIAICSVLASILISSCTSGASQQSWLPKKGKRPKAGQNR
jgi:hypothetical protein